MGKQLKTKLKRIGLSSLILTVALFGYGIYSVYSGDKYNTPKLTTSLTTSYKPLPPPPKPAVNAPESVFIESLDSPVAPGTNTSIIINALAGSKCTISVLYKNTPATDSGLVAKIADSYGNITWSWGVPANTPSGNWPVTVNCAYHAKTAVVVAHLQVNPPN